MASNTPGTRTSDRPADQPAGTETEHRPVGTTTGVGGVSVYDTDTDTTTNPSTRTSTTRAGEPAPVESRSTGSVLAWIIGAVVLIVLVYFLLQMLF